MDIISMPLFTPFLSFSHWILHWNGFYSWSRSKILKSAISRLFSLTGPIGSSSTSSSSTSQSEGTFLTSVHVHSLDIPNRHQYHHLGWPIFQSLCNLSFRAQGAPLVRWGLNSHTSFSEKLALVKSCILGAKWFVVISFWPTKNWWTERRKDIKINIEIIAKATWKLEFKCQFPLSCLSIIICTTCDFLFIRYVDLIHYNWPHSGQKSLSLFHPVMEILGPLIDISGLLWFQELLSLE